MKHRKPNGKKAAEDDARRLREAEEELHAARQRGIRLTPTLDRLYQHKRENRFIEKIITVLEHDLRRNQ